MSVFWTLATYVIKLVKVFEQSITEKPHSAAAALNKSCQERIFQQEIPFPGTHLALKRLWKGCQMEPRAIQSGKSRQKECFMWHHYLHFL